SPSQFLTCRRREVDEGCKTGKKIIRVRITGVVSTTVLVGLVQRQGRHGLKRYSGACHNG
ncbi:unnamed protein product, partial [Amoebophrya sp. A25]